MIILRFPCKVGINYRQAEEKEAGSERKALAKAMQLISAGQAFPPEPPFPCAVAECDSGWEQLAPPSISGLESYCPQAAVPGLQGGTLQVCWENEALPPHPTLALSWSSV